ncbi:hypothetical protein PHSC3_000430 [Chlamydiales bacterium STE3]|nr:hypothetical protein PHSC3_000430 [Chlamydiales bacterium STE3]
MCMKFFADRKLIKYLAFSQDHSLTQALVEAKIPLNDQKVEIEMGWPGLLEYLGQDNLFSDFPKFDEQNELFKFGMVALSKDVPKDLLQEMYDQIFVECLTNVKALPIVNPTLLLDTLQKKRDSQLSAEEFLSNSLDTFHKWTKEQPYQALHNLTLYLAWDRVCVNLAILFEHISKNPTVLNGLNVLKECLLESFQHITAQKTATPSFFRLIEALFAYQMRPEKLESHSEEEWRILCDGANALKSRETLADVPHIDAAIVHDKDAHIDRSALNILVLEPEDTLYSILALAQYTVDKLKREEQGWHYTLAPVKIFSISEEKGSLVCKSTIDSIS